MALGELVGKFERYNSTELRRVNLPGGFPFAITGRIVSGGYGFVVIIVILASSFHLAPHRDDVQPLGGGAIGFQADVATNSTAGPSKSGTLNNEGDSVPFGVDAGEVEWDFAAEPRLVSVGYNSHKIYLSLIHLPSVGNGTYDRTHEYVSALCSGITE